MKKLKLFVPLTVLAMAMCFTPFASCPAQQSASPPAAKAKPVQHPRGRVIRDPVKHSAAIKAAALRHGKRALPKATAPQFDCRTLGWVPPIVDQGQCGSCFPAGTKIKTPYGQMSIEEIKKGDAVFSAESQWRIVNAVRKRHVDLRLFVLEVQGHRIVATSNHPVLTKRGWRMLRSLAVDDQVLTIGKDTSKVWREIVKLELLPDFFVGDVYNLEVDVDHSYVANGIYVHNCWDFSGTCVATCAYMKAMGPNAPGPLSEQYTLDCYSNGGCNGDDNTTVLDHAKSVGLPTTKTYGAYQGRSARCNPSPGTLYKINDWQAISQGVAAVQDIKNALVAYGPVGCGIDADVLGDGTGIVSGGGHNIDHDVAIVGWDDTKGTGCWIMRNSWGTSWGQACGGTESGYCYIQYGSGDIGTETVYAVVTPPAPLPTAPVITSPLTATGTVGVPFTYQIAATNSPTTFGATGLPGGLTCSITGLVTGSPTTAVTSAVTVSATNSASTGTATLTLTVGTTPPQPPGPTPVYLPTSVTLTADQVLGAITNKTVPLTDAQVSQIVNDSGLLDKTLRQIGTMPAKSPCAPCKEPPLAPTGALDLLKQDVSEQREVLKRVLGLIEKKVLE